MRFSYSVQFFSVTQSCLTPCDPMNCSMPDLPVHHQLPEFTRTHVHRVSDAIQPSHPLLSPFPLLLLPSIFPSIRVFSNESVLHIRWQSIGASASVLPMNIQDWFPLGLTGSISLQSKGLSRVYSLPPFKSINSLALTFLYGPAHTSMCDYWKNHSFDYMDLCQQSNVSAF